METKISTLRRHMECNEWKQAISIAAKFPRLGAYKTSITRAHMALTNPRFVVQIGMDVETCIEAGKSALIAAYLEH